MKYLLEGQETTRLKFRLLEQDDFEAWLDLFKGNNVAHFLGMGSIPTPKEQCKAWFELTNNRYKNNLGGMNVLIDKSSNKLIGQCGLLVQDVKGMQEMEVGYSVLPKFWNKGYATEAAQKCRDYAFENNYTDSLISIIHIDNIQSENVALKNGMKKTTKMVFKEMPVNVFRIYKEQWLESHKKSV